MRDSLPRHGCGVIETARGTSTPNEFERSLSSGRGNHNSCPVPVWYHERMTRTIKSAADHTGLTVHTIRYYEKEGLLTSLPRDSQGRRAFGDSDLDWLGYLNCLRLTGMPIAVMRKIAELQAMGDSTIPDRRKILESYRQDLVLKLDQIHSALDRLDHKIEWYTAKEKESGRLSS